MKKTGLVLLLALLLFASGCKDAKKDLYLPEAEGDKIFATVGGGEKSYVLAVPDKGYRYEKDYDDGALEETWENVARDDVEIKVTTYKKSDAETARKRFLRENDDYIFEDVTGYPVCGTERDGDMLWFSLYENNGTVYVVSWEYPRNTPESLRKELADIAETFELTYAKQEGVS